MELAQIYSNNIASILDPIDFTSSSPLSVALGYLKMFNRKSSLTQVGLKLKYATVMRMHMPLIASKFCLFLKKCRLDYLSAAFNILIRTC